MNQAAKRRNASPPKARKRKVDPLLLLQEESERIELTDDDILSATEPSAGASKEEPSKEPAKEPANEPAKELAMEPAKELAKEPANEPLKPPSRRPSAPSPRDEDNRETLPAPPDLDELARVDVPPPSPTPARLHLEHCAARAAAVASKLREASMTPKEGVVALEHIVRDLGAIVESSRQRSALILHEDRRLRDRLMIALEANGYRVRAAKGLMDLAREFIEERADVLLVAAPRERSHEEHIRLVRSLVADERVPVVVLARDEADLERSTDAVTCLPTWGTMDVLIECVGVLATVGSDPQITASLAYVDSMDAEAQSGVR
jgi:hypothetical protein